MKEHSRTRGIITPFILALGLVVSGCSNSANSRDSVPDAVEAVIEKSENSGLARVRARFAKLEAGNISQPFRGVTTPDGIQDGLFSIASTGVTTQPIVDAAITFLGQFPEDTQGEMLFDIQDVEWRRWSNVDNGIYDRQGVPFKAMTIPQRDAAFALMKTSLSAQGLARSRDIMKTDKTLSELNNDAPHLDEELYYFTFMGSPSMTEPWGWQIDGHHLVVNYFVLGDQVVMSPVFMGAEPVHTKTGKYAGNVLFQPEQNFGLELMQSLDAEQQKSATISTEKTHNDNRASANKDNLTLDYEGLPVSAMTSAQKSKLLALVNLYIENIRDEHAAIKMEDIVRHINETHFAWIGDAHDDAVFYYRIHSPVVLIEFDHQGPIGMPNAGPREQATRNHIHTVVRTPNGNDYGKDLLRQHLEKNHPK
jgi:hypothetical protein